MSVHVILPEQNKQGVTISDLDSENAKSAEVQDMDKGKDKMSVTENDANNHVEENISADKNKNHEKPKDEEKSVRTTITNRFAKLKKKRVQEKLVFLISVSTLVILTLSLMDIHWFLPYYYAISTPILLAMRIFMYSKNNWQYFLIDFCYFANLFCYVFMWAVPGSSHAAVILFAISNGPLSWATVMFRNALVFHDMDRMTSCYIHILPMTFSFGLRWFPEHMSLHWYTNFNNVYSTDATYMIIWVFAVPLGCFVLHNCIYLLIVYGICKPDPTYLNSLRYLSSRRNSWQGRTLHSCGEKYLLLTFTIFNVLYSSCSLLLTILFYKYYAAHITFISLIMLIVTWNGASFYTDVFAVKGFRPSK